jgi:hypothetical protein
MFAEDEMQARLLMLPLTPASKQAQRPAKAAVAEPKAKARSKPPPVKVACVAVQELAAPDEDMCQLNNDSTQSVMKSRVWAYNQLPAYLVADNAKDDAKDEDYQPPRDSSPAAGATSPPLARCNVLESQVGLRREWRVNQLPSYLSAGNDDVDEADEDYKPPVL